MPTDTIDVAKTQADIQNSLNSFDRRTYLLNDYNEVYNVNKHLQETSSYEREKLENILDRLRSTLLRIKQEYLLKKYSVSEYSLKNNILHATIVIVCILLALFIYYVQDKLGPKLLSIIVSITIVVFVLIVYLIIKSSSFRVETNWDMYYWGPVVKKSSSR